MDRRPPGREESPRPRTTARSRDLLREVRSDAGYLVAVSSAVPLERCVWTDDDFEAMGWHDSCVHAVAVEDDGWSRLLLDLDYIVNWEKPAPSETAWRFMVAPATLVFENVWDLEGDIAAASGMAQRVLLLIDAVRREGDVMEDVRRGRRERWMSGMAGGHDLMGPPETGYLDRWEISGHNFALRFLADGFHQHFRAQPTLTGKQSLTAAERGGFSFAEPVELPQE
jgi:hypothetical protein